LAKKEKNFWIRILNSTPLHIRRRASSYLDNVKQVSNGEWIVLSESGAQYSVRVSDNNVSCTCPYFSLEKGYCKHICAVAVNELAKSEVLPWLKKLREKL